MRSFNGYVQQVDELLKEQRSIFEEGLDVSDPAAERAMTEIIAQAKIAADVQALSVLITAQRELLLGRIRARQYLLSGDSKHGDQALEFLRGAKGSMKALGRSSGVDQDGLLAQRANGEIEHYPERFERLRVVIAERGKLLDANIEQLGPQVTSALFKIVEDERAARGVLSDEAAAANSKSEQVLWTVVLLSILGGVAAAWRIQSSISKVLRAAVAQMSSGST